MEGDDSDEDIGPHEDDREPSVLHLDRKMGVWASLGKCHNQPLWEATALRRKWRRCVSEYRIWRVTNIGKERIDYPSFRDLTSYEITG